MSVQKSLPAVVIDRQRGKITFDGEELPYWFAEVGPHTRPLGEGISVVWVPVLAESVEEIPIEPSRPNQDFWSGQEILRAEDAPEAGK